MSSFLFRLSALALKFGCPLLILHLASQSELGKYYLSTSFLTFVVMVIALEMAIPFSSFYLKARSDRGRRRVFTIFLLSQGAIASLLCMVPTLLCIALADLPGPVMLMLPAVLVVETCSSEVGRFFWNVGESAVASRRDLYRAIAITSAVTVALLAQQAVVSVLSLGLLTLLNMLLLARELVIWGEGARALRRVPLSRAAGLGRLVRGVQRSLKISGPQVLHGQLLAMQPLLERYLIQQKLGLDQVGAFSFHYSLVQTGASLVLMPQVAKVRRAILSDTLPAGRNTHLEALRFAVIAALTFTACMLITYACVPWLSMLLHKHVSTGVMLTLTAGVAGAANTYAAALSPLYASRPRILFANILTALTIVPLAALILWPLPQSDAFPVVASFIVGLSLVQTVLRLVHSIHGARYAAGGLVP